MGPVTGQRGNVEVTVESDGTGARARLRQQTQAVLSLLRLGIVGAALVASAGSGLGDEVARAIGRATGNFWAETLLFTALAYTGYFLLVLGVAYVDEHALGRWFGLSNASAWSWLRDKAKSYLIQLLFALLAAVVFRWLFVGYPDDWWWATAAGFVGIHVVFAYGAPSTILPLFYETTPLEEGPLRQKLLRRLEDAGFRGKDIFEVEVSPKTKTAQAALVGVGRTRRIFLSDTLRGLLTNTEMEAIVCHELGHHRRQHFLKQLAVQTLIVFGALSFADRAHEAVARAVGAEAQSLAMLPVIAGLVAAIFTVTLPVSNVFSRILEYEADRFARDSGLGRSLASALRKIGRQNLAVVDPSPVVEFLFYTHPSISRRTARLQKGAGHSRPPAKVAAKG